MKIKEYKNTDPSYILPDRSDYLYGLSKINIFVGANNSGKSRFLRELFKGKNDDFVFFDNVDIHKSLTDVYDLYKDLLPNPYKKHLDGVVHSRTGNYHLRCHDLKDSLKQVSGSGGGSVRMDPASGVREVVSRLHFDNKFKLKKKITNKHIYIPMLRGLRHIDVTVSKLEEKKDLYQIKTFHDYNLNNENDEVFTGLSIIEEIKRLLLGGKQGREFISEFEVFLSENFFEGAPITLISEYKTDNIVININKGKDREIFNVGDGIQSIIINTFQAFKNKDKDLILFIEEPELTMHPGMQRILIETLINKFDNLQVFLTTHSNHFLDLVYDYSDHVSIYSFKQKDDDKFYINDVTSNSEIIDLLGVRNSSVFLSNCVIWTEGVTDRMLLKKLLQLDEAFDFKEDYNYAFAEYGGNNLENFDFAENSDDTEKTRVDTYVNTNFIVIDNDANTSQSKVDRRNRAKHLLGEGNVFDDHVEIENLIPFSVWKEVVRKIITDGKAIKMKSITDVTEATFEKELKTQKIGVVLKKYFIEPKNEKGPNYYSLDSVMCLGSSKKDIMRLITSTIDELDLTLTNFPKTAQDIVNSIKKFVESANQK